MGRSCTGLPCQHSQSRARHIGLAFLDFASAASLRQSCFCSSNCMGPSDTEESPLYGADDFRIYCMKVLPCSKRYCHDWTTCPFAHPGEKARRRDPRVFNYTGIACPDMKKEGSCPRREACPYAHNVFEYWLHPTRYRTQLCNDDNRCKRRICFFAHTLEELRVPSCKPFVPPEALAAATPPEAVTDASGSPSEWNQNFGIPKGPGPGAFVGGHTDQALADLQSKLASLQLAVQSTQPGTKLHQDQEMMINVLSAALRNAYVINSFSTAAPVRGQLQQVASAEDMSTRYGQLPHTFQQEQQQQAALSLPAGDARALMYNAGLQQHVPQQVEPRSNSNPELAPWQANSLRQSLAMEYARMSMDSMQSGPPPDPRRMSNAELAYHMSLPDSQLSRGSNSDYSRMSLSDTAARLSLSDFPSRMSLSESSAQGSGLWQAGPSPSSAILQQRASGQDGNIFRSTFYHTEGMQPRSSRQAQSSPLPHHWSPYGMPPSLPQSGQPHPGTPNVNEPMPYGQPPIYSPSTQPFGRASNDIREPTIRASLIDHWQQQPSLHHATRMSLESAPSIDQHPWAVPYAASAGANSAALLGNRESRPAVGTANAAQQQQQASAGNVRDISGGLTSAGPRMGMPQDPMQAAVAAEAAARSSSESSRFSMDSLRRSVDSARYPGSGRTSSIESANAQSALTGSPLSNGHGHDSLFAYQPAHSALTPMASVPEAEPMAAPAAMTSVAELKEPNCSRE
ncbi:hypothetical protein WJX74_000871 [Apatococcus lobatus]|uniref:C3H1-type domain-containing protein n=1 Tax=Apatococcus lobatus TaxID=904363 RepID=A0AAW1RNT1_9CHLO